MEKLSRMWRSGVSLLLALCMVVGLCPVVAFAEETEETKTLNYVSLGDSMANGYGFVGYEQAEDDRSKYDIMTGKGIYGNGAYPLQFEEYLTEQGYEVNHTKLATSAMLAEDLLYLLDGREEFNDGWDGYKDYVGTYSDAELKPFFQNAIKEADLITMGIGNAAFGAFMLNRVTDALGVFGASLDEDEALTMEDAIANLGEEEKKTWRTIETIIDAAVTENVTPEMAAKYNLEAALDIVKYTAVSYLVNFTDLVEHMLEMNPDVNVILVGLLNTTYGMNVTDDDGNVILAFGDMMDSLFDALNAYMAALPTTLGPEGEFYYVAQPEPKFICQVFQELKACGWGDIDKGRLSGTTVRNRNIEAFNGDLAPMIGQAVTDAPLTPITLADVQAYEGLDWNLMAQYGVNPWGGFVFSGYIADQKTASDKILSVAIYLAIEEAVANSTTTMDIQLSGLLKIAGDLSSVFTNLGTPPTGAPESTRVWLLNGLSTEETQGMCKIYGLFKVGNGMSVHPTPSGHDEITANVIKAYEEGYTAEKETDKNLEGYEDVAAVKDIYDYLRSNEYIETEQTYSIVNYVLACLEDEALSDEEMFDTAKFVYETLLYNENLTDEERVDIVENVYLILKDYGYLDAYADALEILEEIVALPAMEKVTAEQAFDIVDYVYNVVSDGEIAEDELFDIAKFIYETLLYSDNVNDHERLDIVVGVYGVIKAHGYLDAYAAELAVLEDIVALPELEYITAKQAFDIVDCIYTAIKDGTVEDEELRDIIVFIYCTVLKSGEIMLLSEEEETKILTAAEKLAVIEAVYKVLKKHEYLNTETIPELKAIEEIYQAMTAGEGEEQLLSDETVFEIIDMVFFALLENGELTEKEITDILEMTLGNDDVAEAKKAVIVEKVYNALEANGLITETEEIAVIKEIRAELKGNGYLTDEQAGLIVEFVYDQLMSEEGLDVPGIAEYIYEVLLENEDLTDEDRVDIVVSVYKIIKKHGYLDDYAEELALLEAIVEEPAMENVTPEQTFAIIDCVFEAAIDGELTEEEQLALVKNIYAIIFKSEDLTAGQKLAIVEAVYKVLKEEGILNPEDNAALMALESLYKAMTAGEGEDQLLRDEIVFQIFDLLATTLLENGGLDEAQVTELLGKIIDIVLNDPETSAEAKVMILETVFNELKDNGLITEEDIAPEMYMIQELYMELKAAGLLTDEQVVEIIREVYPILLSGEELTDERKQEILDIVSDIVLNREDLDAADKLEILVIVLTVLEKYGYIEWPETPEPDWPEVPDFEWPETPDIGRPELPEIEWPTLPEKPEQPEEPEEPSEPEAPVEPEEKNEVIRISGKDRTATARKIADELKAITGTEEFDAIVYASGDVFADALAGTYLANLENAPILLYRAGSAEDNQAYIEKNLAENGVVYILGGEKAVPASVEADLKAAGIETERLSGKTRIETNIKILEETGFAGGETVLVCTGYEYADSLSASATGMPILLVEGAAEDLWDAQVEYLKSLDAECDFVVIGGSAAVSEDLVEALEAYDADGEVQRLKGKTRYETSVLIAQTYFDAEQIVLAYGREFADGLCGGTLAYTLGVPVVLAEESMADVVAEYTKEAKITSGYVLGGTARLTDKPVRTIFQMAASDEIVVK